MPDASSSIRLRLLGTVPYLPALSLMREWTAARHAAHRHQPSADNDASTGTAGADPAPRPLPADSASSIKAGATASLAGQTGNGSAMPAGITEADSRTAPVSRDWPTLAEAAGAGDEIWLMQHPPVFTLGMNARPEHLLAPGDIPVVPTERGGQVTYHGPGQLMAYLMLALRPRRLGIRRLVEAVEEALIDCLRQYGIEALRQDGAPGIYVHPRVPARPAAAAADAPATANSPAFRDSPVAASAGLTDNPLLEPPSPSRRQRHEHRPAADVAKIASIGIKTSNGFSYHGLALNAQMDLSPFSRINPCGFSNLQMTDIHREQTGTGDIDMDVLALQLGQALKATLER